MLVGGFGDDHIVVTRVYQDNTRRNVDSLLCHPELLVIFVVIKVKKLYAQYPSNP